MDEEEMVELDLVYVTETEMAVLLEEDTSPAPGMMSSDERDEPERYWIPKSEIQISGNAMCSWSLTTEKGDPVNFEIPLWLAIAKELV